MGGAPLAQAPVMVAEQLAIKGASRAGVRLPAPLSVALTISVLLATAYWGFFPPVETHTDIAPRIAQAVASNIAQLMERLRSG
jgi:hypothetical protein